MRNFSLDWTNDCRREVLLGRSGLKHCLRHAPFSPRASARGMRFPSDISKRGGWTDRDEFSLHSGGQFDPWREPRHSSQGKSVQSGLHRAIGRSRSVNQQDAEMPRISKMQIDLMVNSFVGDLARVATLQYNYSASDTTMPWLDISGRHHDISHSPDTDETAQKEPDANRQMVLRAGRIPCASSGRDTGAGRRRFAAR